ncbi:MAG: M23 family metallopeptidase [Propionibacteriaceae bacterium]
MFGLSPRPVARRALLEDIDDSEKRSWLSHGIAALGVSLLGLAVAGSVVLTSSASSNEEDAGQGQEDAVTRVVSPGVNQPSAFDRRGDGTSRDASRADVSEGVKKRTESLQETGDSVAEAAENAALATRKKELQAEAKANAKASKAIEAEQERERKRKKEAAVEAGADPEAAEAVAGDTSGGAKPVSSYTIAARFGAVGSWSRYHTGIDFSAPIGTPIHAAAAGVVTHSGFGGEAGGWAGNYVTIQHADGTQSLYAHTGGGTVSTGQSVTAGQVVANVGMTGRTFGAHLHFEIYPAGVSPGDVYSAIDPAGWFGARGVGI